MEKTPLVTLRRQLPRPSSTGVTTADAADRAYGSRGLATERRRAADAGAVEDDEHLAVDGEEFVVGGVEAWSRGVEGGEGVNARVRRRTD